MTATDQAIEIIRATNDGNGLAPRDLYLVQCAVNNDLNEAGLAAFAELRANVMKPEGYTRPWFMGIEHLTKDHNGYVYWKGHSVEHYSFHGPDAYEKERAAAEDLARACRVCEAEGKEVKFSNLVFSWEMVA
ncbi:MAG: hypothetical protein UY96_C0003G0070 [Parcubacteria group bacterium GW2011_GWB1_56_8]|nr:MAG: hypothetical protein UY96_C0003G0070 [Parcubacteria group bacterium GW2011_GWB1_56_8]